MSKIFLVAGLGFGDEGKGTITEYLTERETANTVVRYNGGAQAAHNVVLADGRSHTFSQFGSGTFQNARTHLSRFVVVDPLALIAEARHLKVLGVPTPLKLLTIEEDALLVTPYHKGANRIRELLRSSNRHGSCGRGIGEAVSDSLNHPDKCPRIKDLKAENLAALIHKLEFIQYKKLEEFSDKNLGNSKEIREVFAYISIPVQEVVRTWTDTRHLFNIVPNSYLSELIVDKQKTCIFEGAQGVLLDELWGFHPHTTWSNCTFGNALDELIPKNPNIQITKIGVVRTFLTRHGDGPFPTEDSTLDIKDIHNTEHPWQGKLRYGHFDMVLLRYALDVIGGVDQIALTHVDRITDSLKMAVSYENGSLNPFMENSNKLIRPEKTTITHQMKLGSLLKEKWLAKYWPMNEHFISLLESMVKTPVRIISTGPRLEDKANRG